MLSSLRGNNNQPTDEKIKRKKQKRIVEKMKQKSHKNETSCKINNRKYREEKSETEKKNWAA